MQEEWGSSQPIRFLDPDSVRMYDTEGNVMLCKCGKPAGGGVFGKEAFQVWCTDCAPLSKTDAKFIYKKPASEED